MTRAVQLAGPYRIAGVSYGGILAYEVATQLICQGRVVELLGLFDSQYAAGKTAFPERPKDERTSCSMKSGGGQASGKTCYRRLANYSPEPRQWSLRSCCGRVSSCRYYPDISPISRLPRSNTIWRASTLSTSRECGIVHNQSLFLSISLPLRTGVLPKTWILPTLCGAGASFCLKTRSV